MDDDGGGEAEGILLPLRRNQDKLKPSMNMACHEESAEAERRRMTNGGAYWIEADDEWWSILD